ncbi:MAG TPA: hypothetical protein VMT00_04405 [Thermoanaerobaculia bacterium]|nr:hypothetical protein [Thermoanaerobaculia bacterium]
MRRASLLKTLLVTAVLLGMTSSNAIAIEVCYDYAIWRLTGNDPRPESYPYKGTTSVTELMTALRQKNYEKVDPVPKASELRADDVVIIPGHVGYVTAPNAIDHFIQVEGTTLYTAKNPIGIRYPTDQLPRYPRNAEGEPVKGGFFEGDTLDKFMTVRPFRPATTYEVWRQKARRPTEERYGPYSVGVGQWSDTGLRIRKDQRVRVEASGTWRYKDPPNIEFGPDGGGYWRWFVLKGKVGDHLFDLGSSGSGIANQDGVLQLGAPATVNMGHGDEKGLDGRFLVYVFTLAGSGVPTGGADAEPATGSLADAGGRRPAPASGCDVSGRWNFSIENFGSSVYIFTAEGGGRWAAREEGMGWATGTATVAGNQLRIEWTTGTAGREPTRSSSIRDAMVETEPSSSREEGAARDRRESSG